MLQNFSIFKTIFNDAPQPWQIGFQDSALMQCYNDLNIYHTLYWNFLIINYANIYFLINLLEIINWIGLSVENLIILLNLYILSETIRMSYF
jgi:cytochrome c oxidase subunit 2